VLAWDVEPGATYAGNASLKLATVRETTENTVLWNYDEAAPQASVEVPEIRPAATLVTVRWAPAAPTLTVDVGAVPAKL
jgi:hypothetical protein